MTATSYPGGASISRDDDIGMHVGDLYAWRNLSFLSRACSSLRTQHIVHFYIQTSTQKSVLSISQRQLGATKAAGKMSVDTVAVVAVAFVVSAVLSAGMGATDCANVYGGVTENDSQRETC